MNRNQIVKLIRSCLSSSGWNNFDHPSAALSYKFYDTAVGKKEAQVYFSGDQYNWRLSGLYESQGRNILETESVLIPKDCSFTRLLDLTDLFIQRVETAIANSYAVRLL
jgi:hypothetical protein